MGACQSNRDHPKQGNIRPSYVKQQPSLSNKELKIDLVHRKRKVMPNKSQQFLEFHANLSDNFITHHLKHELSLTKYVNTKRIHRRRLIEHIIIQYQFGNVTALADPELRVGAFYQSFLQAWFQQTFFDIWRIAYQDFFVKNIDFQFVRLKLVEQFMFQLYQLKEYVDSGLSNVIWKTNKVRCRLGDYLQNCNEALINLFHKLKRTVGDRSGMVRQNSFAKYLKPLEDPLRYDLLKYFPSLAYRDRIYLNYQTIYQDITYLLRTAGDIQTAFKDDMAHLLGPEAFARAKVEVIEKQGKKVFNARDARQVFVKWLQHFMKQCPEVYQTSSFIKFIRSKSKIINNFYFKSEFKPTTHKLVIDCICELLEGAKYNLREQRRRQFVFNVYDLLQCELQVRSLKEMDRIMERVNRISNTKSGRAFQVINISQGKSINYQTMIINFRYGDLLIAQIKLVLKEDRSEAEAEKNLQAFSFIQQMQSSILGPTLEMMMQFEDLKYPNATIQLEAKGVINKRQSQTILSSIKSTRICLKGHNMLSLTANQFGERQKQSIRDSQMQSKMTTIICHFCGRMGVQSSRYCYCFQCACILCQNCTSQYQQQFQKQYYPSILDEIDIPNLQEQFQLLQLCQKEKAPIVLFWNEESSPGQIFRQSLILQYTKIKSLNVSLPPILAFANARQSHIKLLCRTLKIDDFPTLILFNEEMQPVRTLIGLQWLQMPVFFESQKRILEGRTASIQIFCPIQNCGKQVMLQPQNQYKKPLCTVCLDLNKFQKLPNQQSKNDGCCINDHYRCRICCYPTLNASVTNPVAGKYLKSTFEAQCLECPNGHLMQIVRKNPFHEWLYPCFSCKKQQIFDCQFGMGYCQQCKLFLCSKCLGYKFSQLKDEERTIDFANHYVCNTATDGCVCICGQLFKKVYNNCSLAFENPNNQISIMNWTCLVCKKERPNGQLHLACFQCSWISNKAFKRLQAQFKAGKITEQKLNLQKRLNVQICIECAKKTGLLLKQAPKQVKRQKTYFRCPQYQNEIISTTEAFGTLTYDCFFCHKRYLSHTQRYYCPGCKLSVCKENKFCKFELWRCNPTTIQHKCPKGHLLEFEQISRRRTMEFCSGCLCVLRDCIFTCRIDESYSLCFQCVHQTNSNFIGWLLYDTRAAKERGDKVEKLPDFGEIFYEYWPDMKELPEKSQSKYLTES